MSFIKNNLGQPIGLSLPCWKEPMLPNDDLIIGKYCRLERLNPMLHAQELYISNHLDRDGRNWTYRPYGPFDNFENFLNWTEEMSAQNNLIFYSIIDLLSGKAVGLAALMNIIPKFGTIEVGHINFSPLIQKKIAATESMYLLMNTIFDLGYRRFEWKCDHLNEPSRIAAMRLGFKFEGTFRKASIYKGRTRDTDYFSIIDNEWPDLKQAFSSWLSDKNFDKNKKQIQSLSKIRTIK